MADFYSGVGAGLGGLFQGAQEAVYRNRELDLKKDENERAKKLLALQMAEGGFQEGPDGFSRTDESKRRKALEEATTQAGLLKSGHKAVYNPETGSFDFQRVPGFHDLEEENKTLQNRRLKRDLEEGKKPSAGEFAASGYTKRLEDAENTFGELEKSGYEPAGLSSSVQKGLLPGMLQGEDVKREEQAKTNFVNSILRRESGAAISKSEFDSANRQYFPQAGDTPAVLDQKKVNRRLAIEGLRAESGKAYAKSPGPQEVRGLIEPTKSRSRGLIQSASASESPDKIASFMKKNGISSRQEAMKILKEHGKL